MCFALSNKVKPRRLKASFPRIILFLRFKGEFVIASRYCHVPKVTEDSKEDTEIYNRVEI